MCGKTQWENPAGKRSGKAQWENPVENHTKRLPSRGIETTTSRMEA